LQVPEAGQRDVEFREPATAEANTTIVSSLPSYCVKRNFRFEVYSGESGISNPRHGNLLSIFRFPSLGGLVGHAAIGQVID
jgi:hypothetical protein